MRTRRRATVPFYVRDCIIFGARPFESNLVDIFYWSDSSTSFFTNYRDAGDFSDKRAGWIVKMSGSNGDVEFGEKEK